MKDSTFVIHEAIDFEGEPIQLLSCPCGKEPHIVTNDHNSKTLYFVSCYCGWRGPIFANQQTAIDAWNTRGG